MAEIEDARKLFQEYADQLEIDLCFQNFSAELAGLPGDYAPPRGRLHVEYRDGEAAACVALRPLTPEICELKRLYVRPKFRGLGLGRALALLMVEEARALGYKAMRLDTLPSMQEAIALYGRMGFQEIPAYTKNPVPGALFLELDLASSPVNP